MISDNTITEIINRIADGFNPDKIVLFGSYASGNPTEDSDVDLLIIKDSSLPRPQRSIQVRKMLLGTRTPLDILVYTPKEITNGLSQPNSFIQTIFSSGKIVYEKPES